MSDNRESNDIDIDVSDNPYNNYEQRDLIEDEEKEIEFKMSKEEVKKGYRYAIAAEFLLETSFAIKRPPVVRKWKPLLAVYWITWVTIIPAVLYFLTSKLGQWCATKSFAFSSGKIPVYQPPDQKKD